MPARAKLVTLEDLADLVDRYRLASRGAHCSSGTPPPSTTRTRAVGEDDFPAFCRRYRPANPLINTVVHGFEVDAYFRQRN